jgi:hypothetical protein
MKISEKIHTHTHIHRTHTQDEAYKWQGLGQKGDENIFKDKEGEYEPDDPKTKTVQWKPQKEEEDIFKDLEVCVYVCICNMCVCTYIHIRSVYIVNMSVMTLTPRQCNGRLLRKRKKAFSRILRYACAFLSIYIYIYIYICIL